MGLVKERRLRRKIAELKAELAKRSAPPSSTTRPGDGTLPLRQTQRTTKK